MPANRHSRQDQPSLPARSRRAATVAIALATAILATAASPSLADTGSVYFDSNFNVGAGHDFFNATFTGCCNVGLDYSVMPNLTTGEFNTALGLGALSADTNGISNVASGYSALASNTTGSHNVASGYSALASNTRGLSNVATGYEALRDNTTGRFNVASGTGALTNSTGNNNVASGFDALFANTSGNGNLAAGYLALAHNDTGTNNVAIGSRAGYNLTTGSDNVDIANPGVAGESGKIRIGTAGKQTMAFLQGVYGSPITGQPVVVNSNGRLGTAPAAAKREGQALSRLRAENRRQSDQLHQLHAAIKRLRQQVRPGG
jgi:hypothetical protein